MSEQRRRGMPGNPRTPTRGRTRTQPRRHTEAKQLPPYKVLLHNDEVNDMTYVVRAIMELVHLSLAIATQRMMEAHTRGLTLLCVTHKERAELYVEQFASKKLIVTIEPEGK
jgi:ATP-dependent Clp protease adaptor protein ClpS